ncbi:unnamed protein product [Paramecium octaurelia]|uniref:Uncharacterized protein n=1 Tax=Paramecium octaurelia TaxID=43137 RepID=A0A8S1WGG5_PAROT|nr:unnamed protein product [Paramecium octaurelia]
MAEEIIQERRMKMIEKLQKRIQMEASKVLDDYANNTDKLKSKASLTLNHFNISRNQSQNSLQGWRKVIGNKKSVFEHCELYKEIYIIQNFTILYFPSKSIFLSLFWRTILTIKSSPNLGEAIPGLQQDIY